MNTCSRGREAKRNDERLYFKFIVKYIEGVHPEIFQKAVELHKEAKENNPGVNDLTKTAQFMAAATPELPVPRYYRYRNLKGKNTTHVRSFPPRGEVKNTTRSIQEGSQMVLEIPLYKHESPPPVTPPVTPTVTPTVTPQVPSSPPLPITSDMYQEMLTELQRDPQMMQILNDFPFGNYDDDDGISDLVWDDISSLEAEMDLC